MRQAGAKTNDLAGDGSTTSVVLAQGLIAEGMKVVSGIPCLNFQPFTISTVMWTMEYHVHLRF